jgi:hypothetical protein
MSESGKTTLARNLAAAYKQKGIGVLVMDPLKDPRWNCDFITADQDEFLDVFWRSRQCMAFLDEGGKSVGRYNYAMQETAAMGRHWGHSCHYISQDPTQLAPIVRDQSRHLFLFCASKRVGVKLSEEFNRPELMECGSLAQGEYIRAARFGGVSRHTIGVFKNASVTDDRRRRIASSRRAMEDGAESESGTDANADPGADAGAGAASGAA